MKILYHFRTQGSGAEGVHIAGIAKAFEALGHQVKFSSPTGVDPRKTAGANPFRNIGHRSLLARLAAHAPGFVFEMMEMAYNAVAWWRNRKLLSTGEYGLIYERHAFFLCSTAFLARSFGIPLVVEVNELPGDERVRALPLFTSLARLADRLSFTRASLVVVVSPHLKRRVEALGVPGERVIVLPNAVSEESLNEQVDASPALDRFPLEGCVVIGFVGWFVAWHQLDRLIREFAALHKEFPHSRLLLVGDGGLKGELQDLAHASGVADHVIFTGSVPHREVPAYVEAMDICVVPHSNAYRSPIKLFEYMARGKAVLAPNTEPIAMAAHHNGNALLFDPESAASLRQQLRRLLEDANLRVRLGTAARESVEARHTWTENARVVLESVAGPGEQAVQFSEPAS